MPGDGACLFHAVSKPLKPDDTANHTVQQTIITDSASSRAFWAKNTIAKTPAAATAAPQTARPAGTTVRPHNARARTCTANGTTLPSAATDAAKSRAPPKSSTAVKKPAAVNSAAQQVKQAVIATVPRDARPSTTTERNTTGTTTAADAAKSHARRPAPWTTKTVADTRTADVFSGTVAKKAGDGSCLLHSLLHSLKQGDVTKMREQIVTWLRANPNHPLLDATLAESVLDETGEQWSEYCNRMQREHVWAGIPELIAAAHVYHTCIRVFANVGPGRFHLWAVLGEKSNILDVRSPPIDIVYGSSHYDSLIDARLLKPWEHDAARTEKPAAPGPHEPKKTDVPATPKEHETATTTGEHAKNGMLDPVARLAARLGVPDGCDLTIKPNKPAATAPRKPEMHETPTVPKEPETPTRELLKVLDGLAACKESKYLEERKARERHEARRKFAERTASEKITERKTSEHESLEQPTEPKTECKAPEQLTEPKAERKAPEQPTEPEAPKDLGARKKPKYQHESRKARAARERIPNRRYPNPKLTSSPTIRENRQPDTKG